MRPAQPTLGRPVGRAIAPHAAARRAVAENGTSRSALAIRGIGTRSSSGTDGATTLPPGFGAAPAGMPPDTQRSGLGPPAPESLIGPELERNAPKVLCSSANTANVSGHNRLSGG